jgi:predicted lipoprotein with Yx(FWY)xxD motif
MLRMIPLALVAALTLAACASSSTSTPPASSGSTVQVANSPQYGSILTDGQGDTLYLFDQDTGKTSACTGACITTWPALTVSGSPTAGTGVDASLLGTAKQADGATQVTYKGHLLYTFAGASTPGATSGEGVEGFFIISSTGDKVAAAMATSSSSSAYKY